MARFLQYFLFFFSLSFFSPGFCDLVVDIPNEFSNGSSFAKNLNDYFVDLKISKSPYLQELYQYSFIAPRKIVISPITNDKSTWYEGKYKNVSHTKALMTDSTNPLLSKIVVVYINPDHINPNHKDFKKGFLVRELAKAYDHTYEIKNKDKNESEKRAAFFENIWRDEKGFPVKTKYIKSGKEYTTDEYLKAKRDGKLYGYTRHLFVKSGMPD